MPRSPAFWGIRDGATTQPVSVFFVRERDNHYPPGPASDTKGRVLPLACSFRISLSLAPCRVPSVPQDTPSASRSAPTEATASVSLWTSSPTKSVLVGARADLRL